MPLHREVEALKLREDWSFTWKYPDHDEAAPIATDAPAPAAPHAPVEDYASEDLLDPDELESDEYGLGEYRTGELEPYRNFTTTAPTRKNIHSAIRIAGKSVPRYLFRIWSATSGGDARLNTVQAITPHAFIEPAKATSKTIFDVETTTLLRLINGHLMGHDVKTPFSSWSHSLPFALSMLQSSRGAHLSVIDTHALKPENYIIHCGARGLGVLGVQMYGEEFLVFGAVEGAAYQAVRYEDLQQYITAIYDVNYFAGYFGVPRDPYGTVAKGKKLDGKRLRDKRMRSAKDFGELFGREFQLPAAVCLLAALGDISKDAALHEVLIREFSIPAAWATDTAFPNMSTKTVGYTHEAAIASKTMVALIKKLQATGRLPMTIKRDGKKAVRWADDEEAEQTEDDRVVQQAKDAEQMGGRSVPGKKVHLKKTSRMPRAVYQLYIDMVGFDEHNEGVKQ